MTTNDNEEKARRFIEKLQELTKFLQDKKPLSPHEYNVGLTSLKIIITQSVVAQSSATVVKEALENFPNSEEKVLLIQRMQKEIDISKKLVESAYDLLKRYTVFALKESGAVRAIIKKAKDISSEEFVNQFEDTRPDSRHNGENNAPQKPA